MNNLVPFPARRVKRTAAYLLKLSGSPALPNRPAVFVDQPHPPEALGNMLQRLAIQRPHAVLVFESLIAEMLAQLEQAP